MNRSVYCTLLALLALPLSLQAAPELNIGGLYDYIEGGRSTLLKRVRNGGDTTAFVKVSVAELVYDTQGVASEVSLEGVAMQERGLVVSPARLIVPARGLQSVRLLYRGQRERERYFRVRFIPVLPEVNDGFAVDEAEAQAYRDSLKAGVNLLAGYGSLLFVRPADTHYQTRIEAQKGTLTVVNEGNSTVALDHFRQCQAAGEACGPATKHHLLPGRTRQFEGQAGHVFQFELQQGGQREHKVIGA
ncbi:putative fimbrial chaperone EcpB [Pseudomonas fluorescens]|uniref:molecular chaperone n=1 Tax=Pseudomonas fluorescens TaxID=294 RepID=UPI001253DC30|nr:molecular chaperone [Pseudomonas fluorescens]CAG8867453.1 putative fimbrial chaperone EcpB [Pseudomonas fluorescens]VVP92348.1 putative fimbrial chaperone EcpB [Pseudomonas fluorescens]